MLPSKCPNCNSVTIPADDKDNPNHVYCPGCNTMFKMSDGKLKKDTREASLDFSGVNDIFKIVDNIYRNSEDISLEEKSVVTAQLTATIYEQWFEGFKAGQLATSMFYRGDQNDGKNRTGSERTDREHTDGVGTTRETTSNRKDSLSQSSDTSIEGRPKRVKELVGGVEFVRDTHIIVPENIYIMCAEMSDILKHTKIKNFSFTYDGKSLKVVIKDFF